MNVMSPNVQIGILDHKVKPHVMQEQQKKCSLRCEPHAMQKEQKQIFNGSATYNVFTKPDVEVHKPHVM